MRVALREIERTPSLVRLEGLLPPLAERARMTYRTRTGATVRIDGETAGAFDREHHEVQLAAHAGERTIQLVVERFELPTNRLPSGDGLRWRLMLRRAHQEPRRYVDVERAGGDERGMGGGTLELWGHSHLDVAWLWPYAQTRRKAVRTFANALALIERDPSFVFIQSQPQLFAFVEEEDPKLFARVAECVANGCFDPSVAALWVEPDCNLPSGESLLRQMLAAHRYCVDRFGIEPSIAWLPDTFGFARTLPTLLAHAGIRYFATTKLQWNDTTQFPHRQFRWRGPDGSEVLGALIASYEGSATPERVERARERGEPLIVGYGDGGGGPTMEQLREARAAGSWAHPRSWFEALDRQRTQLPLHDDELYLEYHRGTYTTHHDVKARNAWFERTLALAEERVAWCIAVHAPRDTVARLRAQLEHVWEIVLRSQFHDVLPGTSVRSAYAEIAREYEAAETMLGSVLASTETILPRSRGTPRSIAYCSPRAQGDDVHFDNGLVRACFSMQGVLLELGANDEANVIAHGNLLAAYHDRPRKWDAWNIDAGYERKRVRVRAMEAHVAHDALEIQWLVGRSPATMRVMLRDDEAFVRVELAIDWREEHTLLRVENWLTIGSDVVTYGAPHGVAARSARRDTAAQRARFEVPGARFATARDERAGIAILALDTYGWNARVLSRGGLQLGHSLLRSPCWPDPQADRGETSLTWAYLPFGSASVGALERAWEHFAGEPRVRLFRSEDAAVAVVACKPAANGDGVIVRVRECDGAERPLRVRCGGRMRAAEAVDGLERSLADDVRIEAEELVATIPAYGLRSFRVRF